FWPEYDYNKQGWLYEKIGTCAGYISYRIDAAFEVYDLAISYDKVKEVIFKDPDVCKFLSEKAMLTGVKNTKKTPENVKKNIDDRLLSDSAASTAKIQCNPPYTDLAVVMCKAVLDWPNNQGMLNSQIWSIITNHTRFDGMTGESGLAGYATMGKSAIAQLCNLFVYADPDFVKTMYSRSKSLYDAYRFHVDLHCVDKYYPLLGDTSYFGHDWDHYPNFQEGAENLMLYELYEVTGDEDLLKAIYQSNNDKTQGCFLLFPGLPDIQKRYDRINQAVKDGRAFVLDSVRKDKYQMAVLRTGTGKDKTEVWINFGTNKTSHVHGDGMNIGIYYKDADLMPDNGYPNVAYGGGWSSPQVAWTTGTLSHNVVSFNNQGHSRTNGRISLWSIGDAFKVFRANATGTFPNVKKYERSLALVDITDQSAYVVDVFRVGNGPSGTYEKYSRSNIGEMTISGVKFIDVKKPYPAGTFLENFKQSIRLDAVWEADWAVEDYFDVIEYGEDMHLRLIDLTVGEKVFVCDTWLPPAYQMSSSGHEGFMLPTVITSKTATQGESVAFVSILEPYSKEPQITQAKRLNCSVTQDYKERDTNVALEVKTVNGATDVVILLDPDVTEGKTVEVPTDCGMIQTDAQSCLIRYDASGQPMMIRASKGTFVKIGDQEYMVNKTDEPTEFDLK
ncbi:MAG TPA: hypothetical protein DDZ89_05545, partial [Clostridiales bacterium]|nr:hypothetical protein [Clostridiales bacterium]